MKKIAANQEKGNTAEGQEEMIKKRAHGRFWMKYVIKEKFSKMEEEIHKIDALQEKF